ncbi:uncharacterized protein [Lolium perenne]|uniref:uncharacterized protein isoform X2 n=1 Tax=Lolium perenne TaxID=4522 RepID=UPI0021F62D94|nr:uncharacterized protein LOC127299345 isoform X2 [Lolium perenne]
MLERNEDLRIAYIDVVESIRNGKPSTEYYLKLVKSDIHGKDKIYQQMFLILIDWMCFFLGYCLPFLAGQIFIADYSFQGLHQFERCSRKPAIPYQGSSRED